MFELTLRAPADWVEPVSDTLADELGALSVSVEDADADTEAERALFGEPGLPPPAAGWARSTLRALFETEAEADAAAALLLAQAWSTAISLQGLAQVPDEDWVRLTQSQFTPVEVTPTFWIVPSWHAVPAQAQHFIRLDPGLAFGTGTHPTTRMCLRWLAHHASAVRGRRTLDYGCGSGILAIAARLLGSGDADAVDIDPAAVQATGRNALDNGVQLRAGLPDAAHGTYGLVLANILASPLKLLAPLLGAHLAPGGQLLLAGILARQAGELQAAYAGVAPGLTLAVLDEAEDWVLMGGQRAVMPGTQPPTPGQG